MRREKFENVVKRLTGENEELLEQMFPETNLDKSYGDILKEFYKDEIIEICENWELKGVKSLNKQKIIEKLEEYIKENIEKLLFNLDSETIDILKKIAKNNGVLEAEKLYTDIIDYFTSKGIAFPIKNSGKYYIYMPKEIRDTIKINSTKELKNAVEVNDKAINLIKGIMLNYGAVERENFFEIMGKFMAEFSEEVVNWVDAAKEYIIYDSLFHTYEKGFAIVVDEESANMILQEQYSRKNFEYYKFSEEELIESGKSGNPVLTDIQKEFAVFLEKNAKKNSKKVREFIYEAVNAINYGKKYNEILEEMADLFGIDVEEKIEEKEFFQYFTEFCNSTRQWVLKGNTPDEMIAKNSELIRIETENHFSEEKIGRNEPCLCGSGKKYKKCCGK